MFHGFVGSIGVNGFGLGVCGAGIGVFDGHRRTMAVSSLIEWLRLLGVVSIL